MKSGLCCVMGGLASEKAEDHSALISTAFTVCLEFHSDSQDILKPLRLGPCNSCPQACCAVLCCAVLQDVVHATSLPTSTSKEHFPFCNADWLNMHLQDIAITLQAELHQTDNPSCCAVVCDAAGIVDCAECSGAADLKCCS